MSMAVCSLCKKWTLALHLLPIVILQRIFDLLCSFQANIVIPEALITCMVKIIVLVSLITHRHMITIQVISVPQCLTKFDHRICSKH